MTIKFFLRDRNLSNGVEVPVYVRVINGKSFDKKVKTRLFVRPDFWDSKKESIKSRITFDERKRKDFNNGILKLREFINTSFSLEKNIAELPCTWLSDCIENFYNLGHPTISKQISSTGKVIIKDLKHPLPDSKDNGLSFFNIYDKFVERQDISDSRARQYKVIKSTLERYQLFVSHTVPGMRKYLIELNLIDSNFLQDFYSFVENENIYFEKYPLVFRAIKKKAPKPRSKNTMTDLFKKFRAFLNWCYVQEYISTKPFNKFKLAREIVDKYFNILEGDLLPFSSPQKYNDSIKIILERCGITRRVTILDPLTRTEKKVPINEVATSHIARRTFIGNIYKKVKDPNLVASLTGHSEGSKAFCRYREIDTEMKRELVGLLD